MDCTKAFDTVKYKELFNKLIDRGIPAIYLGLLFFSYANQSARVRWGALLSKAYKITNGVRQGAVMSPVLFSIYMDKLFGIMKSSGKGCWALGYFCGLLGYADDVLILAPTRGAAQHLLSLASGYAQRHGIAFSTNPVSSKSKTKGVYFDNSKNVSLPANLVLDGNELPWVSTAKYLGCTISNKNDGLCSDMLIKNAIYQHNNYEVSSEFHIVHPAVKCTLNRLFNSTYYGSCLWDYSSREFGTVSTTWSGTLRRMWNLPPTTHRRLIEPLSVLHIKGEIIVNFIGLLQFLLWSPKLPIQVMAQ